MAAQDTNASVRILRSDAEFARVEGANCGREVIVTEGDEPEKD